MGLCSGSALRLELDDLPAALADLVCRQRRHCSGRGEYRSSARTCPVYFRGDGDEGSLLDFRPCDVVDRKSRNNTAIAGDVDGLPAESDKRNDTAQFIAARRKDLRTAALIKCHVTRLGLRCVFDES